MGEWQGYTAVISIFSRFFLIFPDFFRFFLIFSDFFHFVLLPLQSHRLDHRLQVCWLVKASLRSAFTRQAQPFGQRAGRFAAGSFLTVLHPLLLLAFLALLPQEGR